MVPNLIYPKRLVKNMTRISKWSSYGVSHFNRKPPPSVVIPVHKLPICSFRLHFLIHRRDTQKNYYNVCVYGYCVHKHNYLFQTIYIMLWISKWRKSTTTNIFIVKKRAINFDVGYMVDGGAGTGCLMYSLDADILITIIHHEQSKTISFKFNTYTHK